MLCEEGMTIIEARSALLVPQSTKLAASTKIESNVRKIDKHCTNCGMTNQIVETCRKKKKTNHCGNHRSNTTELENIKDNFICMSQLWFEWT